MTNERHATDATFGLELYEELRRQGGYSMVTSMLDYAGIQRLKAASREEVVELFRGSEYLVLQRILTDTPRELAAFLQQRLMAARAAMAMGFVFVGAMIH